MKISSRALSWGGLIIGLLGLGSAYYFYRESVKEPLPTFLVDPVRATIIDSSSPKLPNLAVLFKGRPVGERNVMAVRIYFWNAGGMPIRKSDVLKSVECIFADGAEILDYRVLRSSREIVGIGLSTNSKDPERRLIIDFDILEKNDGVAIQVIYAGPPDATVRFDGVVVGAPQPGLKPVRDSRSLLQSEDKSMIAFLALLIAVLLALVSAAVSRIKRSGGVNNLGFLSPIIYIGFQRAVMVLSVSYLIASLALLFYHPARLSDVPTTIMSVGK